MTRALLSYIVAAAFLLTPASDAFAAKKKKSPKKDKKVKEKVVKDGELSTTTVTVKSKKKSVEKQIYCLLNKTPGTIKQSKKGTYFNSYSSQLKKLSNAPRTPSNVSKMSALKTLNKLGKKACLPGAGGPVPVNPGQPILAAQYSLAPYQGPFGPAEAHLLYERFGFGASKYDIELAVNEGLAATIQRMTTYTYDPSIEAKVADLNCDGELESEGDEDNRACEGNGIYIPGIRYGIYYRVLYSPTPFFEKLFFFLHDERMAAGTNVIEQENYHAIIPHLGILRKAAISGDYIQFMRDWNADLFGHGLWLDGVTNNGDQENYAREFWELGTVGAVGLDGVPNYDDRDIAQSAQAFSGVWTGYHVFGPKVIFHDTPYQAVVENGNDVLEATFRHPRTAENLAEDIASNFISPAFRNNPAAVQQLASLIRANNYNLVKTLQTVMAAQCTFAPANKDQLIKHPMDLLLGFIRQTGLPASYSNIDAQLAKMGQRPLLPPSVFGWYEDKLSSEPFVFDWRNAIGALVNDSAAQARKNFTVADLMAVSDPGVRRAQVAVDRLNSLMGLELSDAAKQRLFSFLENYLVECKTSSDESKYACQNYGNKRYYQKKSDFSPDSGRAKDLVILLGTLPSYRTK